MSGQAKRGSLDQQSSLLSSPQLTLLASKLQLLAQLGDAVLYLGFNFLLEQGGELRERDFRALLQNVGKEIFEVQSHLAVLLSRQCFHPLTSMNNSTNG